MTKPKKIELTLSQILSKIVNSGIKESNQHSKNKDPDPLRCIEDRIKDVLGIINQPNRTAYHMLFFVMYDIEDNRVRKQISKYLLKKGCIRIQKSIFLADLPIPNYELIKKELSEVQQCYDNEDSIIIVPISTDYLKSMKVIGKTISIDIITKNKNTLFF